MNYSTLTDAELNRLIAERKGWRFEREPYFDEAHTKLISPTGVLIYDHRHKPASPVLTKEAVNFYLPDYAGDLNAAQELLWEMGQEASATLEISGSICRCVSGDLIEERSTPQRAICEVWLQWNIASIYGG